MIQIVEFYNFWTFSMWLRKLLLVLETKKPDDAQDALLSLSPSLNFWVFLSFKKPKNLGFFRSDFYSPN